MLSCTWISFVINNEMSTMELLELLFPNGNTFSLVCGAKIVLNKGLVEEERVVNSRSGDPLTSSAPSDEPQVVELGHLVLHDGAAVPQLRTEVLVVAGPHRDHGAVPHVAQRHHLERHR